MFWAKSKNLVGLDIGSSAVKVVELKPLSKGRGYELINIGIESIPPECIVDGSIMDAGMVIDAIQRLWDENKIKNQNVATSVSGNAVIIKRITVSAMSDEELAGSIQWEAEQYIPFDIADVNLSYQILEGVETKESSMEVRLVAVKKDKINDYTSVISQAGKIPMVMDVDACAIQNAYEANYEISTSEVVALVNIGSSVTNVSVLKDGMSVFWRDLTIGGHNYTDAIQRELGLPYEQADLLKKGAPQGDVSPENAQPVLQTVTEEMGNEVQKTMDFFKTTTADVAVDRIMLSGGGCKIPGLQDYLQDRFDCTVEMLNPLNKIKINEKDFEVETIQQISSDVAVAVGLALRKANA